MEEPSIAAQGEAASSSCDIVVSNPFAVERLGWLEGIFSPFTKDATKRSYVDGLVKEIDGFSDEGEERLVARSVSFGPGGVGTLGADLISDAFAALRRVADLSACDASAVFDPGLLSMSQLDALRAAGVNRYIVRFLSADPKECDFLGLPGAHIEMAKSSMVLEYAGAHVLDVQIAIGIFGQTARSLRSTLVDAMHMHAGHVELVPVRQGFGKACASEQASSLFEVACAWLEDHGYIRYAPRCFAVSGAERAFEMHRFLEMEEVGFGVGAASSYEGMIWSNVSDVDAYILAQGDPRALASFAVEADEAILAQRSQWADLYHLNGLPEDGASAALVESGLFDCVDGIVQLSARGSLDPFSAFALL
ncbi:hypothetical protein QP551_06345 [Slackia exigua]|uniref:hypothetical protein n=1 Tax=Slackia exigua TaxID=84109 RepID=UPI002549FEE2|nr:hypothetical protein [Slackia exigua]MDK7724312.1 hypothetical protein [Slackia exigua]MDK7725640.1 hypothetical protein [Slackia exigua]